MIRNIGIVAAVALSTGGAVAAVDIKEVETPLGISAWLVEDHSIPFTALEIRFGVGSASEPEDKLGAAYLMTGLLAEGAAEFDAAEFQKQLESIAASFEFDARKESISVSAKFLTENRDEAVELLRKAIEEPRFDSEPFNRVQSQVLTILRNREKDPDTISGDAFISTAFGDHPYATPVEGTKNTVASLIPKDMMDIHKQMLVRNGIVVGAAGDITSDELAVLLDRLLGGLPAKGLEPIASAELVMNGGTTVVDFPSPQSVVRFGHAGPLRNDPDFLTAYILNEIVGGGDFRTRLNVEVRQKRGLTYGIGSYLSAFKTAGLVIGGMASANERVAEAVKVVKAEWERVATDGVTADELRDAKAYLTGAYPLRFDSNESIAKILAGMQFEGLPASYVKQRNDLVNAVTLEEINELAGSLYKPEELHFVVVGQPEGLEREQ